MTKKLDITPDVDIYGSWRNLNYEFDIAISEYIDNSLHSFIYNKENLKKIDKRYKLEINIEIDDINNEIVISDNSGGMSEEELRKAFKPAKVPEKKYLSEFGMGMKTASCWFCDVWSIITKKYDSQREFQVTFDLKRILEDRKKEIELKELRVSSKDDHYTRIYLHNVRTVLGRKSLYYDDFKLKLEKKYQKYLREGVQILIDGEPIKAKKIEVWETYNETKYKKKSLKWEKNFDFFLNGKNVMGKALILRSDNPKEAGIYYYRNKRLIERVKPERIFGHSQGQKSQRLYIELEMDEFEVSQSKDKINFGHDKQIFILKLRKELEKPPLNILKRANRNKTKYEGNHVRKLKNSRDQRKKPKSKVEIINISDHFKDKKQKEISGDIMEYADSMADCYKKMFVVENYLRSIIIKYCNERDYLKEYKEKISDRKEQNFLREEYVKEEIYYLDLVDLKKIILTNWDLFKPKYNSKSRFKQLFESIKPYRDIIAHNCTLEEDSIGEFNMLTDKFLKL